MTPRTRTPRLWAGLLLAALACGGPGAGGPKERVFLPPGAGFRAMRDSLVAHGVVTNPRWFTFLARVARYDRALKAGYYELPKGSSAWTVLRTVAKGTEATVRFTLPEGSTLADLADLASRHLGIPPDSIRAATTDAAFLREFDVAAPSLEGFLAPETYFVSRLISGRELVREMARLFEREWDPAWDRLAAQAGLTRLDVVTLASIIEGEAKADEDRSLVAAVYRNRLRIGMPLQADPTVQYAIELATGARKTRLYEKDYAFESPYNTYLRTGLPPGPVGAPGRASIEAVLHPAPVPYLYFVAGPDGRHIFSRTYGEHLRAVARSREARRQAQGNPAQGTSTP